MNKNNYKSKAKLIKKINELLNFFSKERYEKLTKKQKEQLEKLLKK